jgi:hypothetical protein
MKIIARTNANDPNMIDLLEENLLGRFCIVTGWTCWAVVHKDMFFKEIGTEDFNGDGIEMELTRTDK